MDGATGKGPFCRRDFYWAFSIEGVRESLVKESEPFLEEYITVEPSEFYQAFVGSDNQCYPSP